MSVTENQHGTGAVSVTPRCQQCRTSLVRKAYLAILGRTWSQPYRKGAQYCSNACRQKAYRRRSIAEAAS